MAEPVQADTIARCVAAVRRVREADHTALPAAVAAAVADLDLLPPESPRRGQLAADLVRLLVTGSRPAGIAVLRHLDRLVAMADRHPPRHQDWRRSRVAARLTILMRAAAESELADPREALAEVDRLAEEFPGDPGIRALVTAARGGLGAAVGFHLDDASAIRTMLDTLDELHGLAGQHPELARHLDLLRDYSGVLHTLRDGDPEGALRTFARFRQESTRLPEGDVVREAMERTAAIADQVFPHLSGGGDTGPARSDGSPAEPPDLAARFDLTAADRALYLVGRGGAAMRSGEETDLARIAAGIEDLRAAVELTPRDHPQRPYHLASLALGLWHRVQVSGSLDGVDEAVSLLEQARADAGGPGHPQWMFINQMLAELRRRRGEGLASRRAALDGLRRYAWSVLLQPDVTAARIAARDAADQAIDVATRCLMDHEPADALRALDAGRGLILFAETELSDPCARLVAAGHAELAQRWRDEAARPSAALRHDVLAVLSRDTGLLDPPDLREIQDALRRIDADALVYLVPARQNAPGWAVIAPVEGAPRYAALPLLRIEDGTDPDRYLRALSTRDAALVGQDSERRREMGPVGADRFTDSLAALCGWAWKAAMGPVVAPYLGTGTAPDRSRTVRLVLIPMGDLARVPWQAARAPDGGYALERVAISQAASARMFCNTATATPVTSTSSGLIVADPDTAGRAVDLPAARLEAYAIHQAFYPGATYVGRRPDGSTSRSGAGSPDDVRDWLRADGTRAGALLHLASHGIIETSPEAGSSRLLLAGGKDLTADELMGLISGNHPLGLVVLAACHTGRSVHGYDEAYSLGTAFLAAGARSVLSTQWSVPDQATSLLMYMFHHFLTTDRRPPWDALRRAQLWMLDPDRPVPVGMPGPLRRALDGTDPGRVVAWAGFVHWGQ